MWEFQKTDELYHYGILGMKWGFRRYQNKDGSLTPAGKRRAAKLKNQYLEVTGKRLVGRAVSTKGKTQSNNKSGPKSIKDLSNEELRDKTNRLRLENDYVKEVNNYNTLHPKKVSLGKRFVSSIGKNVIAPATIEAGKRVLGDYLTKLGRDAAGLNKKNVDPMDDLKKEVKKLELERNKYKFKEDIDRYMNKNSKNATKQNTKSSSNVMDGQISIDELLKKNNRKK